MFVPLRFLAVLPLLIVGLLADVGQRVSLADLKIRGTGRLVWTREIQQAIDDLATKGGGTLVVPEGVYITGALFLKPGVNLHLEARAVLRGSTRLEDYPIRETRIEGHTEAWPVALLNAEGHTGLRITGEGSLEGSGQPFWQEFWRRISADRKTKNLDVPRPRLMFLDRCQDVVVSGISLVDSAFWNLHMYRCTDVLIEKVSITAPLGAPSSDGIDIDSCQRVTVRGCHISVDDDCIALKGAKGPLALDDKQSPPVEHIRIQNCTFGLGGGAITCGSEATVVRDVVLENCRISTRSTIRGNNLIRLKLRPDTPQHYEDIHVRNVTLEGKGRVVSISPWTQYFDLKGQAAPSSVVRNITVSGVRGSFESFALIKGHAKAEISEIVLEDIDIVASDGRCLVGEVKGLRLDRVLVNGKPCVAEAAPVEAKPAVK